jgi:hypothetical protein
MATRAGLITGWTRHGCRAFRARPPGRRAAARLLLWQIELLWRRLIIGYILLRAIRP